MISQIIKTLGKNSGDLQKKYIFGLNIFDVNDVDCSISSNPQLEFLRCLCSENDVSANTGNLYDFANSPEELFGNTKSKINYETVKIGCYGGKFYDSENWNTFPALCFPQISSEFINIEKDESVILKIISSDAICLLVSPKHKNSKNRLKALLNLPLKNTDDFVKEILNLYTLVMTTQADGDYFVLYAQTDDSFHIIDRPLKRAINKIEESSWYKNNHSHLIWDDEYCMCLIDSTNN